MKERADICSYDRKIIFMTKLKPKLKNHRPCISKNGLPDNVTNARATVPNIVSINKRKDTEQDTYEWIGGSLFLHRRGGVAKNEYIQL